MPKKITPCLLLPQLAAKSARPAHDLPVLQDQVHQLQVDAFRGRQLVFSPTMARMIMTLTTSKMRLFPDVFFQCLSKRFFLNQLHLELNLPLPLPPTRPSVTKLSLRALKAPGTKVLANCCNHTLLWEAPSNTSQVPGHKHTPGICSLEDF